MATGSPSPTATKPGGSCDRCWTGNGYGSSTTASARIRYNRTLAYVFLEDGTLANEAIIRAGFAETYRRFKYRRKRASRPPKTKRVTPRAGCGPGGGADDAAPAYAPRRASLAGVLIAFSPEGDLLPAELPVALFSSLPAKITPSSG